MYFAVTVETARSLDPETPSHNVPNPRFCVALRGPFPLTVSHAAAGSCPSFGIVKIKGSGRRGALQYTLPTTWLNFDGTKNISDPHGAAVRVMEDEAEDDEDEDDE